jgi:large subunit ribosomal protein L25
MSETKLTAETRTEFGKGAARRIRREHKIPAVLYGHGTPPVHITLPGHDTMLALKHGGSNALLSIEIEGDSQLALPKQIQRDPVRGVLEHLDLILVRRGEKVTVDVPVHLEGEAAAETLVSQEQSTIALVAEATHIPEGITVSVEGAEVGTQIHASDLTLPSGSELSSPADLLVVNISAAPTQEELEEELAEAEAEAGIERDEPEDADAEGAEGESAEAGEAAAGDDGAED